jgi:hypothetical protein
MSEELIRCPACNAAWQIDRAAAGQVARCPMCQAWITPPPADAAGNDAADGGSIASETAPNPIEVGPNASAPISSGSSAWSARPGQLALWFGLASLASLACCCGTPFLSTPLAVAGLLIGSYGIKQANQGRPNELNLSVAGVGLSGLSLALGIGLVALTMISGRIENRKAAENEQAAPAASTQGETANEEAAKIENPSPADESLESASPQE